MRKRNTIILAITVIVCILSTSSILMGFIVGAKDAQGRIAAQVELDGLMVQMKTGSLNLDSLSDLEYIAVAYQLSGLVDRMDTVTEATHYLRNYLARAPNTLDEMIAIILHEQGDIFGWKLMSRHSTRFHMYGRNGEYNMKFISADGHFEVIYNIDGVKLTVENDPMNMGTFNYGDPINERFRHAVYDVLPYFEWGNTRTSVEEVNGLSAGQHMTGENDHVIKRFEQYWELLYGESPDAMGENGHDLQRMLCFCLVLLALSRGIHPLMGDRYTYDPLGLGADLTYMFSFGRGHASKPFIGCFKRGRIIRGIPGSRGPP